MAPSGWASIAAAPRWFPPSGPRNVSRRDSLIHKRSLMLGNDGKELRGTDQMIQKGRRKVRDAVAFAARFHLAPDVEATLTADGMGAILRARGTPPWNFRCRGAMLTTAESLAIDGSGQPPNSTPWGFT